LSSSIGRKGVVERRCGIAQAFSGDWVAGNPPGVLPGVKGVARGKTQYRRASVSTRARGGKRRSERGTASDIAEKKAPVRRENRRPKTRGEGLSVRLALGQKSGGIAERESPGDPPKLGGVPQRDFAFLWGGAGTKAEETHPTRKKNQKNPKKSPPRKGHRAEATSLTRYRENAVSLGEELFGGTSGWGKTIPSSSRGSPLSGSCEEESQ